MQTFGAKEAISKVSCETLKLEPQELAKGEFLGSVEGAWLTGGSLGGGGIACGLLEHWRNTATGKSSYYRQVSLNWLLDSALPHDFCPSSLNPCEG